MDKRVIAQVAREYGPKLLKQVVGQLAISPAVQREVLGEAQTAKPSIGKRIASAALLRVATRSVPGAILVGGGLIAKALHDRRQEKRTLGQPGKLRS